MNPEFELIFAYLEEDNIQRAYFRARPILTVHGDIREEADKLWPTEGCLRIVPDKNEQHTFKERMRSLGSWCMLDLTGYPPEANKIRTNKNFRPDKGEVNQFILYSDTVKALPESVFYEVLDGAAEDYAALAAKSITPLFFIRSGDTLYGPVKKAQPEQPAFAPETETMLFELALPDGQTHAIICNATENKVTERPQFPVRPLPAKLAAPVPGAVRPQVAPVPPKPAAAAPESPAVPADAPASAPQAAPAPVVPTADEALPIGKPLTILDQSRSFEDTIQGLDQPLSSDANLLHQQAGSSLRPYPEKAAPALSGTPLFRAPLHTSTPQPKNKLQEFVSTQVRIVRNDPPAEPLPTGAQLHQVDNPVETACQALQRAWHLSEAHGQIANFIMSLDGMKVFLTPSGVGNVTALQHAIQQQLQDLEAERLSVLVQLDKAKSDLDAYRKSTIDSATGKARDELNKLTAEKEAMTASIEALKEQTNLLIAQRTELTKRLDELNQHTLPASIVTLLADSGLSAPAAGIPLRINPVSGSQTDVETILTRIEKTCKDSGVTYDRNAAIAFLVLLATCPRIGMTTTVPAAASTFVSNVVNSLGWTSGFAHQTAMEQRPMKAASPASATPAIMMTSLALYSQLEGLTKLILALGSQQMVRCTPYEIDPWPIFPLPATGFVPALDSIGAPVSAESLAALLAHPAETNVVETALKPLLTHTPVLSGAAFKQMVRFASACAGVMDGGLTAACDWAALLWLIPAADRTPKTIAALRHLLAEYPLSNAAL